MGGSARIDRMKALVKQRRKQEASSEQHNNDHNRIKEITEFIPALPPQMDHSKDRRVKLQAKIDHLSRTMHHNVEMLIKRDEVFKKIDEQTERVMKSSQGFTKTSKKVKGVLWWKDKWWLIIAIISVIIAILVFFAFYYSRGDRYGLSGNQIREEIVQNRKNQKRRNRPRKIRKY